MAILNARFWVPLSFRLAATSSKSARAEKLEFVPFTEAEGLQDFIEWWQKIYQENLVDIEIYTHDVAQYYAKGKTEALGGFVAWFDENVVGSMSKDYVMASPLSGPKGKKQAFRSLITPGRVFALPAKNPYPASTMRFMDMGYDPEYAWQLIQGPWDIVIEKLPDGRIGTLEPPNGLSADEWRYQNTPGYGWANALLADQYAKFLAPPNEQRKTERYKILAPFMPPQEEYLPPLQFTNEENAELAILRTDIDDFFVQQYVNWVTQGTNVREAWPDFAAQLKRIGVERYVAIYQAAYNRFAKK